MAPKLHKRPPLVVTRHPALIEYLREIGLVTGEIEVLPRAQPHDVAGRVVYGVLPYHLAACAEVLIYIPMFAPAWLQGKDFTIEQIRQYAGRPIEYKVHGRSMFADGEIPGFDPLDYL